jgi:DNA polymerase-1
MPFEAVDHTPRPVTIEMQLIEARAKRDGPARVNPRRKKIDEVQRPGYGPFNLARGAEVDHLVTDWPSAISALDSEPTLAIDLETSGLRPWQDWIAVVGLYGPITKTAAVLHIAGTMPPGLLEWLDRKPRHFVTQNGLNFDMLFLANAGMNIFKHHWYDTLIGEQVITTTNRKGVQKNLQAIVKRRLKFDIAKDVDHRTWLNETLTDSQVRYVAEDISFLPRIRDEQFRKAHADDERNGFSKWYKTGLVSALEFEMALIPIVAKMECRGLPVDEAALEEYYLSQISESVNAKRSLDSMFGEVNWNAHQQIKRAFREKFDVILPSTTEDVMKEMADLAFGSPVQQAIRDVLTYKHAAKRAGMYNGSFIENFGVGDWIRGQFRPCGTDTGRFSSANPNLQQIPKDKGDSHGRGARHIFGNLEGHKIVSIDYAQIEFRIAANEAGDSAAFALFEQDAYDVHTTVASQVFGVEPTAVSKDQRQLAKAMSFTLLFGGGAGLLSSYAKLLGVDLPVEKARPIVSGFFDQFQGLREMRSRAYGIAASGRPYRVRQPTGLQRVLTAETNDLRATLILNNIVQGTAAAGLKYALVEADAEGLTEYIGAVVHDEIVSAVPTAYAEEFATKLHACMIRGMTKVCEHAPIRADISIADTWE